MREERKKERRKGGRREGRAGGQGNSVLITAQVAEGSQVTQALTPKRGMYLGACIPAGENGFTNSKIKAGSI